MAVIMKRVSDLQEDGSMMARDLLTTFVSARVVPLQRRAHKMCALGSNQDPTCTASLELTDEQVARRVNKIADTKMPAKWEWGLKPYDRSNQIWLHSLSCRLGRPGRLD
jgi:hypothetical protein